MASRLLPEAAVVALALGVQWFGDQHLTLMPWWGPWDFSWPAFLGAGWGLLWLVRGRRQEIGNDRMAGWRVMCFLTGLAMTYPGVADPVRISGPAYVLPDRIQHAAMQHLGPFLIALSWPGGTIARGMPAALRRCCATGAVRGVLGVLQQPVLAVLLFEGLLILWLIPPVTFRAMFDPLLSAVMNASMVADGLLFWFLVLDPRPKPPARMAFSPATLAFLIIFPQIAVGTLIGLAPHDLYPSFSLCGRVYSAVDPLLDQQIGSLILWVPTGMMSALATGLIMRRLCLHDATGVADPGVAQLQEGLP